MPKKIKGYQQFVEELDKRLAHSGEVGHEEMSKLIDATQAYMHAAGELSKDEWELVASYVRRDLSDWEHGWVVAYQESPSMRFLTESIWHWLAKLSDPTQIEWLELKGDLQHQGVYETGELVGLGLVECVECAWQKEIWHPMLLQCCPHCQSNHFYRYPMSKKAEV